MDLIKDLFKGDKVIWIIFLFLCLISIVEVFSAASTLTYKSGDHWGPITQHSVILMVGVCIVVLVHNIPCKYFRVLPFFLLPISAVLLIFVMNFYMSVVQCENYFLLLSRRAIDRHIVRKCFRTVLQRKSDSFQKQEDDEQHSFLV